MPSELAPQEPVVIWAELSEPEVVSAFKLQCGVTGLLAQGFLHALFPMLLTIAFACIKADSIFESGDPYMIAALTGLVLISFAALALGIFKRVGYVEYRYLAHRFYQEPIIYAIGREGMIVSSYQGDNRLPWRSLREAFETPDMIVVVTVRKTILPIPKRCFASDEDLRRAISHLRAFVPNYSLASGQISPRRGSTGP
jgi:hypothetical protein